MADITPLSPLSALSRSLPSIGNLTNITNDVAGNDVGANAGSLLGDLTGGIIGPQSGNSAQVAAQQSSTFWTDLFLRGVVIILGFIFIAVGLSMFKAQNSA